MATFDIDNVVSANSFGTGGLFVRALDAELSPPLTSADTGGQLPGERNVDLFTNQVLENPGLLVGDPPQVTFDPAPGSTISPSQLLRIELTDEFFGPSPATGFDAQVTFIGATAVPVLIDGAIQPGFQTFSSVTISGNRLILNLLPDDGWQQDIALLSITAADAGNQTTTGLASYFLPVSDSADVVADMPVPTLIYEFVDQTADIREVVYSVPGCTGVAVEQLNGTLLLGGPVALEYDGDQLTETGFLIAPEGVEIEALALGEDGFGAQAFGPAGTYGFRVYYERRNTFGNIIRSAALEVPSVVTEFGDGIRLTVPVPSHTRARDANIVVFATDTDSNVFFRQVTISPTPGATQEIIELGAPSTGVVTNTEIDPFAAGELQPISAVPSSFLLQGLERTWAVSSEDPTRVFYSKLPTERGSVEFNDALFIQFQEAITGVGILNNQLVAWSRDSTWVVAGQGPDNFGNGQFSIPVRVTTSLGLTNPQTLVETPIGHLFESQRGIWLLDKRLQPRFIGSEVQGFISQDISQATLLPRENQVRFLSKSGRMLVFDYEVSQWSTFTNLEGNSATIWRGDYAYIQSNGEVRVEDRTTHLDAGLPVLMEWTTSWIKSSSVQGYARTRRVFLLGEELSPHNFTLELGYDYEDEFFPPLSLRSEDLPSARIRTCLLYTSPSPRDATLSRMPSSA